MQWNCEGGCRTLPRAVLHGFPFLSCHASVGASTPSCTQVWVISNSIFSSKRCVSRGRQCIFLDCELHGVSPICLTHVMVPETRSKLHSVTTGTSFSLFSVHHGVYIFPVLYLAKLMSAKIVQTSWWKLIMVKNKHQLYGQCVCTQTHGELQVMFRNFQNRLYTCTNVMLRN